jgi:fructose-bisphosphate aldolase/2-amino-3,7-dideoxy-D-threo-hept-6-ulosonate synthase
MLGRELRLRRIFPPSGRRLFSVPLDHSVSMGPIDGLESTAATVRELQEGGVDLVVVTKGAVREVVPVLNPSTLLGVHLSASTGLSPDPDRKVLVGRAAEAAALGADLVSVQVNFGVPAESEMLRDLGTMVDECRSVGVPLLCMAYVKGTERPSPTALAHAARAAADLGADVVKTSYPGSLESFRALVRSTPVPVLLGGGVRSEDPAGALELIRNVVRAGGAGICIGRNLFQRTPRVAFVRDVAELLHRPAPGSAG